MQGLSESDMISMLSGNGGSQVDLIFYIFTQSGSSNALSFGCTYVIPEVRSVDVEFLRRISPLTNIIPLINRSDTMSAEDLSSLKENIVSELHSNNIKPFAFAPSTNDIHSEPIPPFTVSTYPSKDETMEASLLMSPDYIQPLIPSELAYLVTQVFSPDTVSWLRHSAAKKFIQWRASSTPTSRPLSLYRPLTSSSPSSVFQTQLLTAPVGATTYAMARITDHTQREEKIAQVRLANWAADLQRSLRNERARFNALARSERALWLTERLGECVQDGSIVPISQDRQVRIQTQDSCREDSQGTLVTQDGATYRRHRAIDVGDQGLDVGDPLGLLRMNEELRRKGWVALRVVSGVGIIGGLVLWASRCWNAGEEGFGLGFWGLDWSGLKRFEWR